MNSIEEPCKVAPIEGEITVSRSMEYNLEPYSFHVLRVYKNNKL